MPLQRENNGRFTNRPANLLDEQTRKQQGDGKRQGFLMNEGFALTTTLLANGGSVDNPLGFPGYLNPYLGNPPTYRWMLQNPILRLVRSICVGVIASSTWEYEKFHPDAPQDAVDLVQWQMNDLRSDLINDFFARGRDMGWASGEIKWKTWINRYVIEKVKPLLVDTTEILRDEFGNFQGLKNYTEGGQLPTLVPAPFKAWKYTFDGEADYPYGRSWLENVRKTAWTDWLDAAQQLHKQTAKIAGMVTVIKSPAGTFPGDIDPATGKAKQISYKENAMNSIKALASGAAGIWFPSLGLAADTKASIDAIKVLAELAGKSLVDIEVLDFGSQSAAITGIIERMKHDEELMFAGGERSSRTGLQGQHGTKEEAGIHTDTGTLNAERDDRDFAKQCQGLVDAITMANYGDRAISLVRIKTPSLVDRRTAVLKAIVLSIMNDPDIAAVAAASGGISIDKVVATLGVPSDGPFDKARLLQILDQRQKALTAKTTPEKKTQQPDPQGGRPEGT